MKVQNPIIGRARGSAGGMTFCMNYDKNVARAKAFEVSNPKTQAQQTQRAFFTELTAVCSDFSDDQLRTLFPNKPKTMSRRNALSKQIAQSYEINGTEKLIDFADITTLGNAPVKDLGDVQVTVTENTVAVLLLNTSSIIANWRDNYFIAALINVEKKSISLTTESAIVDDAEISLGLPSGWESTDTIIAIPLITNTKSIEVLHSGFGNFTIALRPPR